MKRAGRELRRFAAWFFGLIALFTALMTLAFCIPDGRIAYRQETSAYILETEQYKWFGDFFGTDAAMLDNPTDTLMIDKALPDEPDMSPLEKAMYADGYSRYWNGYLTVLRPLLTLFDYWQIRYVNMFCFFFLLCAVLLSAAQRQSKGVAFSFLAAIVACYVVVIPVSLQYTGVFHILFCALLFLLPRAGRMTQADVSLAFMAVGMVTSFLDLLTVPLLTLGMPLLFMLEADMRGDRADARLFARRILCCSLAWGMGYALCWASKWVIGALVLKGGVFGSAQERAVMWLGDGWPVSKRLEAIRRNFSFFFAAHGKRVYLPLVPALAAYLVCLARWRSENWRRALAFLPVCAYPYLWYFVMAYHSTEHTWFTNRLQAMTLFGALLFLIELVDWKRAAQALGRREAR